jgi:hypothetical protein
MGVYAVFEDMSFDPIIRDAVNILFMDSRNY